MPNPIPLPFDIFGYQALASQLAEFRALLFQINNAIQNIGQTTTTGQGNGNLSAQLASINASLQQLVEQGAKEMAAIDDLNNAVASIQTAVQNVTDAINAEIAALQAAQASGNDAAITAATQNITNLVTTLNSDVSNLTASVTPAPAPAPAPGA